MIYVVSGLRRSGTSMMMHILLEGGMDILVEERTLKGDKWNPNGYFEWIPVEEIIFNNKNFNEYNGKLVKIICSHISIYRERLMTPDSDYKVIWMDRDIKECVESWRRKREGKNITIDPPDIDLFTKRRKRALSWLESQSNIDVLRVYYKNIINVPRREIEKIRGFLGIPLDIEKAIKVVDRNLYRVKL